MKKFLTSYSKQSISNDDIQSVVEVLRSDFLTQGPKLREFEHELSVYTHARYAIACANGTAALHMACLAAELGPGDSLWTVPITFLASANCARYCGAEVDFIDIELDTFCIDADKLEEKLLQAKQQNKLPKVLVVVHFAGLPCNMPRIARLAEEYGFLVIEDAAHALGACTSDEVTGQCRFSDMTTFSFHPVKSITTGEGGAVTTNNAKLAKKLQLYRSHGIVNDADSLPKKAHEPWYYEQHYLGFNYRLSDIHAALGISQLKSLDTLIVKRQRLASVYRELLLDLPVKYQLQPDNYNSAYHLFVVLFDNAEMRRQAYFSLMEAGFACQVHYIPVHLQPFYQRLGFKEGDFPVSENYYQRALSIPLHPMLEQSWQDEVVGIIHEIALVEE